jgi:hypothetical protein
MTARLALLAASCAVLAAAAGAGCGGKSATQGGMPDGGGAGGSDGAASAADGARPDGPAAGGDAAGGERPPDAGPPAVPEDSVCSDGGWCWSNPWPIGSDLSAVWVVSANDVWVGGEAGAIIHFDGTRWTRTPQPGTQQILSLWGSAANDIWAVGGIGTLLHWNGQAWKDYTVTTPVVSFACVWGSGPNDVWAAGLNGVIYYWDGRAWGPTISNAPGSPNSTSSIWSMWGSGTNDVWAGLLDATGSFLHWDGGAWHPVAAPAGSTGIHDVWGSSASDVWASTASTILHYDGQAWSVQATGLVKSTNSIETLWGTGPSDVWAALEPISLTDPHLAHWDGQAWTVIPSLGFAPLDHVGHIGGDGEGGATDDLWLVGQSGTVIRGDGTSFQQLTGNATQGEILSIAAQAGPDDVWVTSGGPFYRHQAASRWQSAPRPDYSFQNVVALWRAGANDLWAILDGYPLTSTFSRWNGSAWSAPQDIAGVESPAAAWGSSTDDVWIAGNPGAHLVAGQGTATDRFLGAAADVWGSGPNDVWMVGQYRTLEHWDGQKWTQAGNSDLDHQYFGVWGAAASDVWVVGDAGTIQHWDGSAWTAAPSTTTNRLRDVWGSGASDVWVVGDGGTILHWTGSGWVPSSSGTTRNLVALTGTAAGEAWATGAGGVILHHPVH